MSYRMGHPMKEYLIGTIRTLSDGTVAGLCGSARYDEIDRYREEWVEWVEWRVREGAGFESWMEAHAEYEAARKGAAGGM